MNFIAPMIPEKGKTVPGADAGSASRRREYRFAIIPSLGLIGLSFFHFLNARENWGKQGEWCEFRYTLKDKDFQKTDHVTRVKVVRSEYEFMNDFTMVTVYCQATNMASESKKFLWRSKYLAFMSSNIQPHSGIDSKVLQPGETSAVLWIKYVVDKIVSPRGISWGFYYEPEQEFKFSISLSPESKVKDAEIHSDRLIMAPDVVGRLRDQIDSRKTPLSLEGYWSTISFKRKEYDEGSIRKSKIRITSSRFEVLGSMLRLRVEWEEINMMPAELKVSWTDRFLYREWARAKPEDILVAPRNGGGSRTLQPLEKTEKCWAEYQFRYDNSREFLGPARELLVTNALWGFFNTSEMKFKYMIRLKPEGVARLEEP